MLTTGATSAIPRPHGGVGARRFGAAVLVVFLVFAGLFATAQVRQRTATPAILVPTSAVQTTGGTSRVYVVNGDRVEERIVTTGQTVDALVEITNGLKAGERVATTNVTKLSDGARIQS